MFPLLQLSWLAWSLLALACVQTTIFCVTLYLHRAQAHRALDFHPALAHVVRLWLWLTTGMSTRQWVSVHRKHHAHCETPEDPHSPKIHGLARVLFTGVMLYHREAKNPATLERYGKGAPDDWMEREVYERFGIRGPVLLVLCNLAVFGLLKGGLLSAVQLLWIPFWAAGVINGLAHSHGYRNFNSPDESRNLLPWGLWIGGEELHNNHHAHPTSAKLSYRPWEVDIGWGAIQVLSAVGLVTVRKAQHRPRLAALPQPNAALVLERVLQHRLQVGAWYKALWQDTVRRLAASRQERRALNAAFLEASAVSPAQASLQKLHAHWAELQSLWQDRACTRDQLVARLDAWLHQAEASAIQGLPELALRLRRMA